MKQKTYRVYAAYIQIRAIDIDTDTSESALRIANEMHDEKLWMEIEDPLADLAQMTPGLRGPYAYKVLGEDRYVVIEGDDGEAAYFVEDDGEEAEL